MNTPPLTQADLLALLRRTTDKSWLDAMLAQPDGLAVINSWLAIFAAASEAVGRQVDCSMISTAPTGRSGVCTLTLRRSDTSASATIPKGYTFVTKLGVELTVACDVQIAVGQATVALPLVTTRQIDLVNTVDPAFDDILNPGDSVAPIVGPANQPTSFVWTPTGPLPTPQFGHTATLLPNGDVVVAGGFGASGYLRSVEIRDAVTGIFSFVGNMSAGRWKHTATYFGPCTGHPSGGVLFAGGIGPLASADIYDIATGQIASTGGMTAGRSSHAATLLQSGKILITSGGGDGVGGATLTSAEIFDPTSGAFTLSAGTMHAGAGGKLGYLLPNGTVVLIGGAVAVVSIPDSEIYDPVADDFTVTGSMSIGREWYAGAILPNGNVLIGGGYSGGGTGAAVASAEIYDWQAGTFSLTGSMTVARMYHTLTTLPDGDVLAIGYDYADHTSVGVDLYSQGVFAAATPEGTSRTQHTATLLPNGMVLAIGGVNDSGILASAEVFTDFVFSLVYVSSTPITGAVEDWLSALGNERGCIRQDGEDGETYRARVRMIPDAVSPLAVARAVDATVTALPERWLAEPFNDGADPNAKLAANLGFFDGVFCDADFCDDPLGTPLADKQPVANLECSGIRESRAYVRVDLVGQLQEPDGSVLYCDDGFCDDPQWGFPDVHTHPVIQGAEQVLLQEVQHKVAGGVNFDVYLENSETLVQQSSLAGTTGTDGVPVFTLTPDAGTAWYLREGLLTADMGGRQWAFSGQGIAVRITLDDGTVLQTPWALGCVTLRSYELEALGYRGQRVTSIEGCGLTLYNLVLGPGGSPGDTMNLIGNFTVNTCTL